MSGYATTLEEVLALRSEVADLRAQLETLKAIDLARAKQYARTLKALEEITGPPFVGLVKMRQIVASLSLTDDFRT